jgi:NMD protein affecting ribosome stability and mRNA decay
MKKTTRIVDPDGYIICRKCLGLFPRTNDFFSKNLRDSYKLMRVCKVCDNLRRSNKEKERAYHNIPRLCLQCKKKFYASYAGMRKYKKISGKMGGTYCSNCRGYSYKGKSWEGKRKGINNPNAILEEKNVKEIKKYLSEDKDIKYLMNLYKVSRSTIYFIKTNRSWTHIN